METIVFVIFALTLMIVYWYWFDKNNNEKVKLQRKLNDCENICRILKENFDKAEKDKKQCREDYNNLKSIFEKSKEKEAKINIEGIFGRTVLYKLYAYDKINTYRIDKIIIRSDGMYVEQDGKVQIKIKDIIDDVKDKDLFINRSDILKKVEKIIYKDERTNN